MLQKNERKNNNNTSITNKATVSYHQSKNENGNNNKNKRTLLVGPTFSDKTYLMLKTLSRIIFQEETEEIKHLSEYEKAIRVFDDILGSSNSRHVDHFFIRGRHNYFDN